MGIALSNRLRRVADYVERGGIPVDVGTDHAYVPIWLLQNCISPLAYATEVKPGPLKNAEADAARAGVRERLTLYLCDGLAACAPESVDTVILAGMGGETMQKILAAAPWALEKRLILQPQTKVRELRRWLGARGSITIADASLVYDTGRVYLVWLVGPGDGEAMRDGAVDPVLLEKRDPLLLPYTEGRIKQTLERLHGMERARRADAAALDALRAELEELREVRALAAAWSGKSEKKRTTA